MTYRTPGDPGSPVQKCTYCEREMKDGSASQTFPDKCWECVAFLKSDEPRYEYAVVNFLPASEERTEVTKKLNHLGKQGFNAIESAAYPTSSGGRVVFLMQRKKVMP